VEHFGKVSYSINAFGVKSDLQTPHSEYLALGKTKDERLNNYRELLTYVTHQLFVIIQTAVVDTKYDFSPTIVEAKA
jgi:hypothetical protein